MEKLQGKGRPSNHLAGQVGQWYEDTNTGDIYECRIANEYSTLHGAPVGGYVWERRARGEDVRELYGSSGGSSAVSWNDLTDKPFWEETEVIENTRGTHTSDYTHRLNIDGMDYAMISDSLHTKDELVGCKMTLSNGETQILTDDMFYTSKGCMYYGSMFSPSFFVAYDTDIEFGVATATVPSTGVYTIIDITNDGRHITKLEHRSIDPLDSKFLPKATAIENVTEAPTAEQFNALLQALRDAGYMSE